MVAAPVIIKNLLRVHKKNHDPYLYVTAASNETILACYGVTANIPTRQQGNPDGLSETESDFEPQRSD